MFDKAIIDTDRFMDLSMSSKALYFLLGMEADDEGYVSYKKVMRIHGGNEDDIKVLIVKNFLIRFESGVVVITDWNSNNYLDKNRTRPTEYQKERKMIFLTKDNKYELNTGSTSIEESSIVEKSTEEMYVDFEDFWKIYPRKVSKKTAVKIWISLKVTGDLFNRIVVSLEKQKKSPQWSKNNGEYIPHPTTWLRQERWEDEINLNDRKIIDIK